MDVRNNYRKIPEITIKDLEIEIDKVKPKKAISVNWISANALKYSSLENKRI